MEKYPSELGKSGRAMWKQLHIVFQFDDPREVIALKQACLLQDDLERLRSELASADLIVKGSYGQPVESPILGAIRNGVALQARLLSSIAVDPSSEARSHAGRALASQRWAKSSG